MGIFLPILQVKKRSPRLYHQEMAELGMNMAYRYLLFCPFPRLGSPLATTMAF